jgi:2-hydroxy-3-oxopropionate reductase
MIERRFEPGARVELHQKDLELALAGARAMGLALPGTALAQQLFSACRGLGGAGWDHAALVKALEALSGHEVAGAAGEDPEPGARDRGRGLGSPSK